MGDLRDVECSSIPCCAFHLTSIIFFASSRSVSFLRAALLRVIFKPLLSLNANLDFQDRLDELRTSSRPSCCFFSFPLFLLLLCTPRLDTETIFFCSQYPSYLPTWTMRWQVKRNSQCAQPETAPHFAHSKSKSTMSRRRWRLPRVSLFVYHKQDQQQQQQIRTTLVTSRIDSGAFLLQQGQRAARERVQQGPVRRVKEACGCCARSWSLFSSFRTSRACRQAYRPLDDQRAWNQEQLSRFLNPATVTDKKELSTKHGATYALRLNQDIWIEVVPHHRQSHTESNDNGLDRKPSLASLVCEETMCSPLLQQPIPPPRSPKMAVNVL